MTLAGFSIHIWPYMVIDISKEL